MKILPKNVKVWSKIQYATHLKSLLYKSWLVHIIGLFKCGFCIHLSNMENLRSYFGNISSIYKMFFCGATKNSAEKIIKMAVKSKKF